MLYCNSLNLQFATVGTELAVCRAAAKGNLMTRALHAFETALGAGNCLSSCQTSNLAASLRCMADALSSVSGGDSRQRAGLM